MISFKHKKTGKVYLKIESVYFNENGEIIAFKPFSGNYRRISNNYECVISKEG
jgi:hypothetical protein